MTLYFYILKQYLKDFLLLLLALTFVVTIIDFVQHFSSIEGINREFLYFIYSAANSMMMIYPLALVFAAIVTLSRLITRNHLIVLGSFGYPKKVLVKPLLSAIFGVYFIIIALNFTQFAYSSDTARAIIDKRQLFKSVENLFFKYNDSFVYVEELDVANKILKNITMYTIDDKKIEDILRIERATFKGGAWLAQGIRKEHIIFDNGKPLRYDTESLGDRLILEGYFPKVISLLYEGKRMSIQDGFKALKLLNEQKVDSSKVIAALYEKLVMPLFAPIIVLLILIYTPISKRYMNPIKYYLFGISITILTWVILYGINILTINSVLPATYSQPLVILLILFITIYLWFKESKRLA